MNQQSRRVPNRLTVLTTVIAAYKLRLPAWAVASRASVGVIRASDLGVALAVLLLLQCGSHLADSALLYGGRGVCAQRTQEDEECGEGGLKCIWETRVNVTNDGEDADATCLLR